MFWKERHLDIFIEEAFELVFIPTGIDLPSLHNKGGIGPNSMTKGFIYSQGGLDINELDEESMFVETS